MSPPIPLVMIIVILFDWRMEYFLCLIGPKNFNPKINWKANHSQFSLAFEGRRGHWLEGRISKLPLDKGNKLKERSWKLTKEEKSILCGKKRKGGEWMCEKKISSYVWKGCSWKKCVQEISMEGIPWQNFWSFISNSCSSQIHCWIYVKL